MLNQAAANMKSRLRSLKRSTPVRQNLRSSMARKRFGSILLYSAGAFVLAISSSIVFNFIEHDTEFAIAVTGSLIGGFLGAMLAAALIVGVGRPVVVLGAPYGAFSVPRRRTG